MFISGPSAPALVAFVAHELSSFFHSYFLRADHFPTARAFDFGFAVWAVFPALAVMVVADYSQVVTGRALLFAC